MDIIKHWRGEVPLLFSFWENFVSTTLISFFSITILALTGIALALTTMPKLGAIILFGLYPFGIATIVWQVVGVWRSANHSIENGQKKLWGICAKITVILYAVFALVFLKYQLPSILSFAKAIFTAPFFN